ncbi:PhzF family phenazine biosynthesis protein [Couchioplanes caeruleus]|uniref:Epimerase n=2 Tax=Couchioplanes caeruleus TaxID=56438 RepID=A0A1K0FE15_9ACTN|nr:PhzF family phenazine biosynthesis protein [Couchioplanes caeruleus]OJF11085.1 epimerase [Couchioplanes caeruleus subsp. caeruleus]ROP33710.1 PhzF family phenazine biosynthesis protein [Couchioplanes caeruleus]
MIAIVNVCLREGRGGSPTAVVDDAAPATLTDAERSRVPVRCGTSHAVFVTRRHPQSAPGVSTPHESRAATAPSTVDLRFFTAGGELPACGHGTIAAMAFLARQRGSTEHEFRLCVSARTFAGRAVLDGDTIHAAFDPGSVALREPASAEIDPVVAALGVGPDLLAPGACVASLGRARMLIPVATPAVVAALVPEFDRLRAACDRFGLLGCYVYSAPTSAGRVTARMFAPSIGVPEDIANANSTACLAAHLADRGVTDLRVDMGDALGSPATITASTRRCPTGLKILVGGAATFTGTR